MVHFYLLIKQTQNSISLIFFCIFKRKFRISISKIQLENNHSVYGQEKDTYENSYLTISNTFSFSK